MPAMATAVVVPAVWTEEAAVAATSVAAARAAVGLAKRSAVAVMAPPAVAVTAQGLWAKGMVAVMTVSARGAAAYRRHKDVSSHLHCWLWSHS